MNRLHLLFFFLFCIVGLLSCNHSETKTEEYSGMYVDEYGNHFTLNEDHTGSIVFANSDKVNDMSWNEGDKLGVRCATISYNGNPEYYYLYNGYLFLHKEDMLNHSCPIVVKKIDKQ